MTGAGLIGTCARCGLPVRLGEERRETVHQGTGPGWDVLLHRQWCRPPGERPGKGQHHPTNPPPEETNVPDNDDLTAEEQRDLNIALGLGAAAQVIHSDTATAEEKALAEELAEGMANRLK